MARDPLGFYLYAAAFTFTLLWAIWEVGFNGWALTPRLAGPFVLMVIAVLLVPTLPIDRARRVRSLGLGSLAVVAVVLGVGVSLSSRDAIAMPIPAQQASLAYDDAAYAPRPGEWDAYGGGASAQRYSDARRSRWPTSRISSARGCSIPAASTRNMAPR
jgi:quinoprotein glucose dehydrogenase